MKKFFVLFLLACCVTLSAFSQVRWNGWGKVVWVPLYVDQTEKAKSVTQAANGSLPAFEFYMSAASDNIGVDVGVGIGQITMPPSTGISDLGLVQIANAKAWWKANNYFKLHVGVGRVATLRGKIESSSGMYAYTIGRLTGITPKIFEKPVVLIDDGDGIFSRFNLSNSPSSPNWGAIFEITPIRGLFVGAAVAPGTGSGRLAESVYRNAHIAAGYEINNIGHVRVGYIGGEPKAPDDAGKGRAGANWDFSYDARLEAAFALTAVPGLLADFGFKYSLEERPGILAQPGFALENPLYMALGVVYTGIEKITIGFAMDGHFAGKADISAPQIAFNIYPSYNLGFMTVGADITYGMQFGDIESVNDNKMFGFDVYAHKQYGHGSIRGGFALNAPMNKGEKLGVSFPIWIVYSF
jgi:hypothetical protein